MYTYSGTVWNGLYRCRSVPGRAPERETRGSSLVRTRRRASVLYFHFSSFKHRYTPHGQRHAVQKAQGQAREQGTRGIPVMFGDEQFRCSRSRRVEFVVSALTHCSPPSLLYLTSRSASIVRRRIQPGRRYRMVCSSACHVLVSIGPWGCTCRLCVRRLWIRGRRSSSRRWLWGVISGGGRSSNSTYV
jgi:hypothetical protein